MKKILLAALLVLGTVGCTPTAGTVRTSTETKIVLIEAGAVPAGNGNRLFARYLIDTSIHECWFMFYRSTQRIPCCKLKRLPQAAKFITWATPGCESAASSSAPLPPVTTP